MLIGVREGWGWSNSVLGRVGQGWDRNNSVLVGWGGVGME